MCGYYDDTLIKTEILSKNLSVCGNEIKGKVANAQATFSFINDIEVADGATYVVCTDLACTKPVLSKTINLSVGDNVCYILVTNGNDINLYTVTVRRRPFYTVAFNSNGGTEIKSQQVEEDSFATKPADPAKTGYDFSGFDYNFNKPIVKDTTINANWQIITYRIYYNLNGGVNNTKNPTTYTVEDKIELKPALKTGYTLKWSDNGVIEKGSVGDKTFIANWQVITYKISYVLNGGVNDTQNPTTYTVEDKIELKSATKTGYTFMSWSNDGVIERGSLGDVTFTANYTADVKLSSDGSMVTGLNNMVSYLVVLSEYNGVKVTSIGEEAFSGCSLLKRVTIPDSVTSIGESAFYGCSGLQEITIPFVGYEASKTASDKYLYPFGYIFGESSYVGGVATEQYYGNSIGSNTSRTYYIPRNLKKVTVTGGNIIFSAFFNCTSLTSVIIGDGVTSIGNSAFYFCKSLTSVTIGNGVTSIGWGAVRDCTSLTNINVNANNVNYKSIDGNLYSKDGKTLIQYATGKTDTAFVIPDSVTSIGQWAFYRCTSLTSVTIGNGVTSIENAAFCYCSSLTSVTIPDRVTSIGSGSFNSCSSLTSVTIGSKVTSIGQRAFYRCTSLTSVTIGNGVTSIGNAAFKNCTSLTDITIPKSVMSIGESAFGGCSSLESITIPNSAKSIYDRVFSGCTSLKNVSIGDSVTSIGRYAFKNCTSLESITIPDSVTSISESAFDDCSALTSIIIPDSVTSIGQWAFRDCTSLTKILWNAKNCTEVGKKAGVEDYTIFYGCNNLKEITIGENVKIIPDYAFYGCSSLTSVKIGNGVATIGDYAFYGCSSLEFNKYDNGLYLGNDNNPYMVLLKVISEDITSCEISGKCKMIYSGVFYDCGLLTSIVIPDSVATIGGSAFSHCTSLTSVTIGNGVTSIGWGAFYGCSKLTSVTIPDSVATIGGSAFSHCSSLINITIPNSVTNIGDYAFYDCSSLKTINYKGGKGQWNSIRKGYLWNENTGSYVINYNYVEN